MSAPALNTPRGLLLLEALRIHPSSIPNYFTASRIFAAAVILLLSLWAAVARFTWPEFGPNESYKVVQVWLTAYALGSDFLDGWIARAFGWTSPTGEWFDPLADKLFSIGVGLAIVFEYAVSWYWLMYIVYIPTCYMLFKHGMETSRLRFNHAIGKASEIAKVKTAILMGAQAVLIGNVALTVEYSDSRLAVLGAGMIGLLGALELSRRSVANYRLIAEIRGNTTEWSE